MIAVIFEVQPAPGRTQEYLDLAARLRPKLETIDGFIAIERLRVAGVIRDYGMHERVQAPDDSRAVHDGDATS